MTEEQAAEVTKDDSAPSVEAKGTIDLGEVTPVEETETLADETAKPEVKPETSKDVDRDFIPEDQLSEAVKKRFGQLTAKSSAAEREVENLRSQLEAKQKAEDEALLNKPAPTDDDIFDPEELLAAQQAHWIAQGEARGRQAAAEESTQLAEQAKQAQKLEAYNAQAAEFSTKAPDFHVAMANLNGLHPLAQQALMEIGPEGSYYASKNMEIAQELHTAAINAQAGTDPLSLGRLASKIETTLAESANKRTISQAGAVNEGLNTAGDKPEVNPILVKYPGAKIE